MMVRYIRGKNTGNKPFGWFINILSINVAVWLVIRDGLGIIGKRDCDMSEL